MDAQQVFTIGQQGLYVLLMVAAPILLTVLAVGVLVSVFQAATQINESTLSFVPKIVTRSPFHSGASQSASRASGFAFRASSP